MRPDPRNEARPRLAGRGARYFLSGNVAELAFDARLIIAAPQRKGYSRPASVCGMEPAMASASRDRAFRRLVARAVARHGADCCHGCRLPLKTGDLTLTGRDRQHRPMSVAGCCAGRLATVYGIGVYLAHNDPDDQRIEAALRSVRLAPTAAAGRA
jgi:hypothetical protein